MLISTYLIYLVWLQVIDFSGPYLALGGYVDSDRLVEKVWVGHLDQVGAGREASHCKGVVLADEGRPQPAVNQDPSVPVPVKGLGLRSHQLPLDLEDSCCQSRVDKIFPFIILLWNVLPPPLAATSMSGVGSGDATVMAAAVVRTTSILGNISTNVA